MGARAIRPEQMRENKQRNYCARSQTYIYVQVRKYNNSDELDSSRNFRDLNIEHIRILGDLVYWAVKSYAYAIHIIE